MSDEADLPDIDVAFPKNDPVPADGVPLPPDQHTPEEPMSEPTTGVVSTLTDGTGVSALVGSKIVKDVVLDFLLALPPALLAINVMSLEAATAAPVAVAFAVGDVIFRVGYRAILRWAQSPE